MNSDSIPVFQRGNRPRRIEISDLIVIGLVGFSVSILSWDDLVAHLALGIAIGVGITTALWRRRDREARDPHFDQGAPVSAGKTIAFWVFLFAMVALIWQVAHAPTR